MASQTATTLGFNAEPAYVESTIEVWTKVQWIIRRGGLRWS
jgi:hypothetical protein